MLPFTENARAEPHKQSLFSNMTAIHASLGCAFCTMVFT